MDSNWFGIFLALSIVICLLNMIVQIVWKLFAIWNMFLVEHDPQAMFIWEVQVIVVINSTPNCLK